MSYPVYSYRHNCWSQFDGRDPYIYIYIDEQCRLMWNMLDCPDVSALTNSQVLASGNSFRFHSAERLVPLVHSVEDGYVLDSVAESDLTRAAESLGIPFRERGVDGPVVVSHLTQIKIKTLRGMWRSARLAPCRVAGVIGSYNACALWSSLGVAEAS